ncbi:MAG: cytochrome c3 family protein [Hydrogenovibrio sp.]|uniref:c(7)-type cytochrome triheme domain-containing protein n=1 Tax=Hydrogenovibrio sp. TaxID=2065821 RepID=UPI0028709732|nr:c(7)-type cytochrome triheme domain-containing protein [Hydrogenovibrio sp.]MDR9499659.1 cytochrome c3 family protein [Hydrogenovibrio sp.]
MQNKLKLIALNLMFFPFLLNAQPDPMAPLAEDGVHDPNSPAFHLLQEPSEALSDFPTRPNGDIDWVKALNQGIISPRANLAGDKTMNAIDLDIVMKNTASMPPVLFSHKVHTEWLTCSGCHVGIFLPKAGASFITMNSIIDGQYCGVCHGTVAFDIQDCDQCHKVKTAGRGLR